MLKKLDKVLNYIDETKTESSMEVIKWCTKNDCWLPKYNALILGYIKNYPCIDYSGFNEELHHSTVKDSINENSNIGKIFDYIDAVKVPDFRGFIRWLNRCNRMKYYMMAEKVFNESYIELIENYKNKN